MKSSSKNNYSGKNSKQYTKNSDPTFVFKNKNSSKKENKFRINSSSNQSDNKFHERDKKKRNFSSLKVRKPVSNSNIAVSNRYLNINQESLSKRNFDGQDEKIAKEKVEKIASGKAKRNFSEEESGDMTAMRGAAGGAKGGPADYQTIDKFIKNSQGLINFDNIVEFRKIGKLGEFK